MSESPETLRRAYFGRDDDWLEVPVITRAALAKDRAGPLIVEEYDATCVIPPRATARLDDYGNKLIKIS